jgi:hypothetical protein
MGFPPASGFGPAGATGRAPLTYNDDVEGRSYAILCGISGALLLLLGALLTFSFYGYHAGGETPMRMGPGGAYFAGFAGTALLGWGGSLVAATRWRGRLARSVGTATAVALVFAALQRMMAWLVGDYAAIGELPRIEAGVMLVWALAFVWLRPQPTVGEA